MSVGVKICGITTLDTLDTAVEAGADYIGFVFYPPSPRALTMHEAISLKRALPPQVKSVAVTVNPGDELLEELQRVVQPDYVQLHGSESTERVRHIKSLHPDMRLIKAIGVEHAGDIESAKPYALMVDMLLFDAKPTPASRLPGGNGIGFNWSLVKKHHTPMLDAMPWFLSGGLTPENVQEAIGQSGAALVDVSSGVEHAPGQKDNEKIRAFLNAAHEKE